MKRLCALLLASALVLPAFGANVPRPAPDLTINLPDGKKLQLSQYKGKVVALEFVLTTCPHCQKVASILEKMNTQFGPQGFAVLAVAVDPGARTNLPEFRRRFGVTFPIGIGVQDTANTFMQHPVMLRMMMPQLAFIDQAGIIQAQYGGSDKFFEEGALEKNIRAQIQALLKKPAPSKPAAKKKK